VGRVGAHGASKNTDLKRARILKTKWASLRKRGYEPPANNEERKQRLRECAHDRVSG